MESLKAILANPYLTEKMLPKILLELPYENLFEISGTHPAISNICSNDDFWAQKSQHDFGCNVKPDDTTWHDFYFLLNTTLAM